MKLITIDGEDYCVGLSWDTMVGPGIASEAKSYTKKEEMPYGIIFESIAEEEQERNLLDKVSGHSSSKLYQIGVSDDDECEGVSSLSFLIGHMTVSSGLYCLTVGQDEKWILAINNGAILPSTDIIVKDDKAQEMVGSLFAELEALHTAETPLCVIVDDAEMSYQVESHDESFVDIIASTSDLFGSGLLNGEYDDWIKKSKIKNLEKSHLSKVLALLVIGGFGYYYYTDYRNNQELQAQIQAKIDQQKNKIVKKGPSDEELLNKAKAEEKIWLKSTFNSISNKAFVNDYIGYIEEIPRSINGWKPVDIAFNGKDVKVNWVSDGGTPEDIREYFDKVWDKKIYGEKGDIATTSKTVTSLSEDISIDGYTVLQKKLDKPWLISQFMDNNLKWNIAAKSSVPRPAAIEGLKNKAIANQRQIPLYKTEFQIENTIYTRMIGLMGLLNEQNKVKIKKITYNWEENAWQLTGEFYEV